MSVKTDLDSLQQTTDKRIFLYVFGANRNVLIIAFLFLVFIGNSEHANLCPVNHLSVYLRKTEPQIKSQLLGLKRLLKHQVFPIFWFQTLEDDKMNEMKLPSRHRTRNSSPDDLRSRKLHVPIGHEGSIQY